MTHEAQVTIDDLGPLMINAANRIDLTAKQHINITVETLPRSVGSVGIVIEGDHFEVFRGPNTAGGDDPLTGIYGALQIPLVITRLAPHPIPETSDPALTDRHAKLNSR